MGAHEGQRSDVSEGPRWRGGPRTYFAEPERVDAARVRQQARAVRDNPVVGALLQAFSGWVAVLNEHRQILALNNAFLHTLGIDNPSEALGLRPGEALQCEHAHDHPGGCGTSQACRTCGAAIAIVSSLTTDRPHERECVMTTIGDGGSTDHDFLVRTFPFQAGDQHIVLISMREISEEKQRVTLQRMFLHDMANILTGLSGALELLVTLGPGSDPEMLKDAWESSRLLNRELQIQRMLMSGQTQELDIELEETTGHGILERVERFFASHPAARGRHLRLQSPRPPVVFRTDVATLHRVLLNLVLNALEAGEEGDSVCLRVEDGPTGVTFLVWNAQPIPESVAPRIFQRYFSTKSEPGRGLGTYSTKVLCESILLGRVTFQTSREHGTTFRVDLPREPAEEEPEDTG